MDRHRQRLELAGHAFTISAGPRLNATAVQKVKAVPVNREFPPCRAENTSGLVSVSVLLLILNSDNIRV